MVYTLYKQHTCLQGNEEGCQNIILSSENSCVSFDSYGSEFSRYRRHHEAIRLAIDSLMSIITSSKSLHHYNSVVPLRLRTAQQWQGNAREDAQDQDDLQQHDDIQGGTKLLNVDGLCHHHIQVHYSR